MQLTHIASFLLGENMHDLKILADTDESVTIGGYGVVFDTTDLEGETFTRTTDYMLDLVPKKLSFIDHGLGAIVQRDGKSIELSGIDDPVGYVLNVTPDDKGLYMELLFSKANEYWDIVEGILSSGKAGLSTGTIGHLSKRAGKTITRWPIVETSLTMTPAEPRTIGLERLKSIVTLNPDLKGILLPEMAQDTIEQETPTVVFINTSPTEEIQTMSEDTQDVTGLVTQSEFGELTGQVKALDTGINAILEKLNNSGKLKDAGYVAPDSETDRPQTKSFGDWLIAVKNKNTRRLNSVYHTKVQTEGTGSAGGFMVPDEFLPQLLQVMGSASIIRSRASVFPVSSSQGAVPALDQATVTTQGSGESAFVGGVVATWTTENGSITETDFVLKQLQWTINKMAGYTQATSELRADSAIAIETLITTLFGKAVAEMEDYAFLRGTGAGQPLGILDAANGALINVTTATNNQFALADAMGMLSRFQSAGGSPVWIIHPGLIPDFDLYFQAGTAGVDFIQPREGMPQNLLGYPVLISQHSPQDDNSGDAVLVDLSAYAIFDHSGLSIDFSEHVGFLNDRDTWRFTKRLDGRPWVINTIELADPTGSYTVSPFVSHND